MTPRRFQRLLPATIVAMGLLLVVESSELVRAAMAAVAPPAPSEAPPPGPAPRPVPPVPVVPAPQAALPAPQAALPAPQAALPAPPAAPAAAAPPLSDKELALLTDLRARREQLDARAAQLTQREGVLAAAEARLTARLDELAGLQKRLESLEQDRRQRDEANWQGLVKLYASMKPRDAAAIFNDLDLPVVLPILDRMKERSAAAILAAMQPERARLLTAELARLRTQQNSVPPPRSVADAVPAKSGG
jgi:flagellar motility protein MotE (MotC chaperone)